MDNKLCRERFDKIAFLCESFSVEHLAVFCDWLEEKGFKHQKYKDALNICYKHEFTIMRRTIGIYRVAGLYIRMKTRTIVLSRNGNIIIKKHKPTV